MSSIPLPALGIKPIDQPDMFGNLAKALSVRDLMQQSRRSEIDTQQAQQGQADQQAFRTAMTDPSMKGKTIGEIADALAGAGHISQASWVAAKKADVDQRKSMAELDEKTLINRAKSHEMTFDLYKNVMAMPDDQLATAWPQIAQQYDSIPGNKPILDPAKPLTKQQLGEMGPMLDMHEAYLASELAKRKAANEAKTSGMKEAGNVLYDVTGEKPVAVAGNPPVEQQELNSWLDTKQPNGKTRRENGATAADYAQAKGTHTSTQSDNLGITTSTTTAPGLNRGAAPVNPASPQQGAARPGTQAPSTGKTMSPAQAINAGVHGDDFLNTLSPSIRNTVKRIGDYRDDESMLTRITTKHPEVLSYISQYAPDFDRTNYDAKRKLMIDYTSGTHSKEINAVNTAMGHVAELGDAIDALKNGDIKFINSIANKLQIQTGGTAAATVALIARRVAPEIATVYTPTGGGQTERIADEKDFDFSLGADILKTNISKTVDLLRSKIGALESQYKNTVGRDDFEKRFITPQAKGALQKYSTHAAGGQGGITVTDPRGIAHSFPNQQAADAFKKAAGIQ